MTQPDEHSTPSYIVFREVAAGQWQVVGEVNRRPGFPARVARACAIADAVGRPAKPGEVYAVLPRSEWRLALEV